MRIRTLPNRVHPLKSFVYGACRLEMRNAGLVPVVTIRPRKNGKSHTTKVFQLFLARWARKLSWKETAESFCTSWDTVFRSVKSIEEYGLRHRSPDVDLLDPPPRIVQQIELEKTVARKEEHRAYSFWCERCGKIHYHPFPENVAREGLFKERPTALVAYVKAVGHASFSTIRKFIRDIKHLAGLRDAEVKAYGRKLLLAVKAMFKTIRRPRSLAAPTNQNSLRVLRRTPSIPPRKRSASPSGEFLPKKPRLSF